MAETVNDFMVQRHDLVGLRLLRDRAAPGIDISAGEYGYDLPYFRRMLEAEAIDVLQADATRCAGVTGFMRGASCVTRSSYRCRPIVLRRFICIRAAQ